MSEVITAEVDAFAKSQLAIVDRATSITVSTKEQADAANDVLLLMRGAAKALEEKRAYLKAPHLEAGRRLDSFFNSQIDTLTEATKSIKLKIAAYIEGEEAKRREEEALRRKAADEEAAKLQREARAREEEAAKIRAKAEQEAANARKLAEEAAKRRVEAEAEGNAKAAAQAAGEAARQAERARNATEQGEAKATALATEAQTRRDVAAALPAAATPQEKVAPKGFSTRFNYDAKVTNFKALVEAVAAGRESLALLQVNEQALRSRAKSEKDLFSVTGCELVKNKV